MILHGLVACGAMLASCGHDAKPVETMPEEEKTVTENSGLLKVDNKLVVIPSAIQMTNLIQKSGVAFDKANLTNTADASKYTTVFQQAINLGIYGADAGYASAFNQSQPAMEYMGAAGKLAEQLDLSAAFGSDLMSALKGGGNKEALMNLVATAYKSCDELLDKGERTDAAAMIACGAWIESMHCALNAYQKTKDAMLLDCIASQGATLKNLLNVAGGNFSREDQPEFANAIDTLQYVLQEFNQAYSNYTFVESTHDAGGKKSVINSTNQQGIQQENLDRIITYLEDLRRKLIS